MNRDEMYLSLGVSDKVLQFGEAVLDELKPRFAGDRRDRRAQSGESHRRNAEKPRERDALRRLDRLRLR